MLLPSGLSRSFRSCIPGSSSSTDQCYFISISCLLTNQISTLLLPDNKRAQDDRPHQTQKRGEKLQEARHGRPGRHGDKLEKFVHLVQVLLPGDDVPRRRGVGSSGRRRGGHQVEDCDEADAGTVEGDEPDGEGLEDGEVDQVGSLVVDCD